ncbi:hypothetical protein CEY12_13910 [Chryseobacterium sp. T16E-39]|uniref:hypothetical protein n=1 Tax=Chryseobacterium sp. T16E-39 TaxID=2015076 RepID=UPI000B5B0EA3|nr:hypothetical protein [Chryseobacterium sp. T16E-39]ASK31134.1 hypothetical protein CEY12_13910 [Chryseobacterium sp. T16E-39]
MSKRKLLIQEVFKQAKEESGKDTKNGLAAYLWSRFEDKLSFKISDKTFSRYYETFIEESGDTNIEPVKLDKLSEYLGYKDFLDFSRTFIKKNEDTNKTTVKISVDRDEESLTEKLSNIIINISNEQHFKMPEFIKQNGLGIMEILLLVCLVTGNVVFSNSKKAPQLGFMSGLNSIPSMECMYWDGSEYKLADCKAKNPHLDLKPVDTIQMKYFKRITRKDTLTEQNALGKTWYSKYNGVVEFFTDDGIDPNNGRELRKSTPFIIFKYAGKPEDSIQIEE